MRKDALGTKLVNGLEQKSPRAGGHKLGSVTRGRFPPVDSSVVRGEVFRRASREFHFPLCLPWDRAAGSGFPKDCVS